VPIAFVAPQIDAALATLERELPDAIAAFNAEAAAAVELATPQAYVFGAADPLVVFPTIEVAAGEGSMGNFAVARSEVDHDPQVTVVVWHEGERGELSPTYRMSLGMARCVIEVLTRPEAFGAGVEVSNDDGAVSWRTAALPVDLTEDGREFAKWQVPVLISFRLENVERF
jgi:hypothetical protein